jgi:ribosomal small subunit protein bTHX
MGKGDKRTRRGKIFKSSYGKTRSHKKKVKKPARAK